MSRYAATESNRLQRLRARILSAVSSVRHCRLTAAALGEQFRVIQDSQDWKRAPGTTREYLHGFFYGLSEGVWAQVVFCFVTERGPVVARPNADKAPGMPVLSDEECRDVGVKNYPRGFAWPPTSGKPLAWFTEPEA